MTQYKRTMFQFVAFISTYCFALFGWAQQTRDVAYFEMVRVKPSDAEKFEATMKRHWAWHEKQGETWNYFVWTVDTGKDEGAYKIASFGHTWKEVDESSAQVEGTPAPEENPEPYHQSEEESYYVCRTDLSIGSREKQPLPLASVTRIVLKPEAVKDFEVVLQQFKRLTDGENGSTELSAQWLELVTGGDQPQFLLIEERQNWTSLGENSELAQLKKGIHSDRISEEMVKSFWKSIQAIYVETWHYRSDLSRIRNRM